jgi:hypothetical protein
MDECILAITYSLVCVCGLLQKEKKDIYAIVSYILLLGSAVYIVLYLSFTYDYCWLSVSLGLCIWVHHILIHRHDTFENEITLFTFQINDISNHETWIVACFVSGITWLLA